MGADVDADAEKQPRRCLKDGGLKKIRNILDSLSGLFLAERTGVTRPLGSREACLHS